MRKGIFLKKYMIVLIGITFTMIPIASADELDSSEKMNEIQLQETSEVEENEPVIAKEQQIVPDVPPTKEGWAYENGETYYYQNGVKLEGFQNIDGKTYFFGIGSARLLKGWQSLGSGKKFYLYEDGTVKQGFQQIGVETYYVRDNYMVEGFQNIDGKTYFFGIGSARLLKGWQNLNDSYFYLYEDGSIKQGFQNIDGNIYYVGEFYTLKGEQIINGKTYIFANPKGALITGFQTTKDGKKFFINEQGEYQVGWVSANNEIYYMSSDTGYALEGFQNIGGKTYFFGIGSARLLKGWQSLGSGKKFYLYEDGTVKQGFQQIGVETYYVRDNYMVEGLALIEDNWYLFGIGSARLLRGWQTLDNNIYYAAMDGILVTGNQFVDGRDYIFDANGRLQGFKYDNGHMYYYNPDGTLAKGVQRIAGKYYKFNEYTGAFENYVNQKIVIDVSYAQGEIDWDAVKNSGLVDGVIVRIGYGSIGLDRQFLRNINELNRLGIPYSIYLFSYAENGQEAQSEAKHVINLIKSNPVWIASNLFSIYYDLEDWYIASTGENSNQISKETYTEMFMNFSNMVEAALGIDVKIYASKSFIEKRFLESLRPEVGWVAQWNSELTYDGTYEGWQYTDSGSVPGIKGNVDMSIFYY